MLERVKAIHAANRGVYGARRIHAELRHAEGVRVGRKRVERLMRQAGISALPFAARALVISGVLVTVMMRLVLPVLSGAAGRWLARPDVSKLPSSEPSMKEADSDRQIHHPPLRSAR